MEYVGIYCVGAHKNIAIKSSMLHTCIFKYKRCVQSTNKDLKKKIKLVFRNRHFNQLRQ